MEQNLIACPKCNTKFPLTNAIEQPIVERLRTEFAADTAKKESAIQSREALLTRQAADLAKQRDEMQQQVQALLQTERQKIAVELEKRAKEAVSIQLTDLQQQNAEKDRKLAQAQQEHLGLLKQKRQLETDREMFELEKQKQIEAERQKIREEAAKSATEAANKELLALRQSIAVKEQKLAEAEQAEMEVRKQKAELEEQKKSLGLEMIRRSDAIKESVAKEKDEEFRLRKAEKNKQMDDLKRQIDEWRRKSEQSSQQAQGEVLELDLESSLRRCFNGDEVTPVPKGTHGGDLLHTVRDERGHPCGTIIWELKRTKTWSDAWLAKLKDDKLAAKAHIALLVSVTMPKDVAGFECRENVWISPVNLAVPLAAALRLCLIESSAAKRASEGRHDKMAAVYDYLAGPDFKARIAAIFETFTSMRNDLEAEKKAMYRIWAKREKQLERVLTNTVTLHGELQGIIGQSLPQIESMELEAIADEADPPAEILARRE